ncbi:MULTISPECIES: CGNR zinc finger domain-containing protein [unclassified Nocardiopsis]|uniref:CGNR zinc finger domain-containing protein n=1 Tax=unclassified Nocardiopsis TaxID=2649073 RepID=UPI001358724E|nr:MULTISPECIES: CGNR zinc finger domain-containing protein [unclassified Nocardiopsis]
MSTSHAIAGRSVRAVAARTTDLLNVLAEEGTGPADVARVPRAHGEREPVTGADVERMRGAAHRVRAVLAAEDTDGAAELVNRLLAETRPPRLTDHGGTTHWHVHVDSHDDAPLDEWFLASSCLVLALLLTDRQRPPGGLCAAHGCARAFVDCGSGSPRRYCPRRCATRARVAAHRAAAGDGQTPEVTATASTSTSWSG